MDTSKITVRRDGTTVTLTVDGRVSTKQFDSEKSAVECYDRYKHMIKSATELSQ